MRHDDQLVALLATSPGFEIAEERVEREIRKRVDLLALYIHTVELPLDQRSVDFERGFAEGARWFFKEVKRKDQQLIDENSQEEIEDE